MKKLLPVVMLLICGSLFAQEQLHHVDSIARGKKERLQSKADSLKGKIAPDSATSVKIHKADSTIKGIQSKLTAIESAQLPSLAIPDSLTRGAKDQLSKIGKAKDSLQGQINKPITTVQKKIDEKTSFLDSLNMSVKNPITDEAKSFGINGPDTNITTKISEQTKLPDNSLSLPNAPNTSDLTKDLKMPEVPEMKEMSEIGNKAKELKQLPKDQLEKAGVMDEVGVVKDKTKQIGEVAKKGDVYKDEIKNIKEGGLEKAEALPKEVEKAATNISEVKGIQQETQKFEASKNVLQQYQDMVTQLNKEKVMEQGKEVGQKQLADHFTGNEEKLKAGVAQLDKLKRKYGSIPDSRYLPKRAPNQLKGKPLIERIIPGVNLQVFQQMNLVNVDLSPFVAYRIYPRWRAALGGTYRMQFTKHVHWADENPAFGFRAFTNYNVFSGFHLHLEYEWMNTIKYNSYLQSFDPNQGKDWIPGLYAGLLKHYKVSKKINGNFQVLYNFLYERNGLYPNKVNMRFGFEFPMKKKPKPDPKPIN